MRTLLRGGLVADGIGATTRRGDVLIDGPVIASVAAGDLPPGSCEVIELAPGSVICPGFIDAHVHAEGPLLADGVIEGALAQGVTTLVAGQDGQSWIGATKATADYLNAYFGPVNGTLDPPRDLSVAGFADALAGRLAQNVAVLASQGTIRHNIAGLAGRPLDPEERAAARQQLQDALAAGAAGLSSGLDYLPSRFGDSEEIAAMARPLAEAGRPYVSHMRGHGPDVRAALDELIAVGRSAGTRVHASHLWGPPAAIEAAFAAADADGVPVSFDMYPYRRSSTILAMLVLPPGLQARGPAAAVSALGDPRQRAELLGREQFSAGFLGQLYLSCLPAELAEQAGLTIAEAARRSGQPPGEWVLGLLASAGLGVGVQQDRPGLDEQELAWLCAHDRHCGGSDGIYQGQHPHPRGYAAFATLAGQYLAGGPGTGYQVLARHLAATAADVYGLSGRGRLAPGLAADLCVIAPGGLTARAGYDQPRLPAAGADLVMVNGVITWRDGRLVPGARPGRLVS